MLLRRAAVLALCIPLLMPFGARAASPQLGLHLKPCTIGKTKAPAECGTFGVYENRAKHAGKTIALNVVVLKAKHPSHKAIAMIAGGPGQGATEFAETIAAWVRRISCNATSLRNPTRRRTSNRSSRRNSSSHAVNV